MPLLELNTARQRATFWKVLGGAVILFSLFLACADAHASVSQYTPVVNFMKMPRAVTCGGTVLMPSLQRGMLLSHFVPMHADVRATKLATHAKNAVIARPTVDQGRHQFLWIMSGALMWVVLGLWYGYQLTVSVGVCVCVCARCNCSWRVGSL